MTGIGDMPNPSVAADAEQHMRAELTTMARKGRTAGLVALAAAGVVVGTATAWIARRKQRRQR